MAVILFNGAELFGQIVNTLFKRRPHVKSAEISEKTIKNNTILKKFYHFNHTSQVSVVTFQYILRKWLFNIFHIQIYGAQIWPCRIKVKG